MFTETLSAVSESQPPGAEPLSPFDLTSRAELAIRGCTGLTDPNRDSQPYSYAELHTEPPVALHAPWDHGDSTGHLLEALTLARAMCGSRPDQCDAAYAGLLQKRQRPDGLLEVPAEPWSAASPITELDWSQRGALLAWNTRYLSAEDTDAERCVERLVRGLMRAAVWEADMCWFPGSVLPEGGWAGRSPGRGNAGLAGCQMLFPLARLADTTGNEDAGRLAAGMARYLVERSGAFDRDGNITPDAPRPLCINLLCVQGVLKVGLTRGRPDYVDWAKAAFLKVKELGSEFGFFPHTLEGRERLQGDTCALATMIELAVMLGQMGEAAYYADAERFGRNQLLESQLQDLSWVERRTDTAFSEEIWCANHPPEGITTDSVSGRAIGGFAGWSRPNDAIDPANPRLMQRSTAAGVRALYDLWHYAVTRQGEAVMVNLIFSRDSRWAAVKSFVPAEGAVEVMMKTRGVLAVRVPDYAKE
ncbi:MAG TPA: hypothetical protein VGS41_12975, partial [Chthonomonadales bacterium]|nr:hypothetical protein [Chthonomonadales bacterium]